jgi:hypothetical protein
MIWAIGNGESRRNVNINNLSGVKVGCNAIHRDFHIDHLICVDRRMVKESLTNPHVKNCTVYTRKDWWITYRLETNLRTVPELPYKGYDRWDEPFQWGSGPYSVLLAAKLAEDKVGLIGFDLYSNTQTVNNIYKNSENYDTADKKAVDPRYWIHQISKVFESFSHKKFIVYQTEDWILPDQWKFSNVIVDSISNIH